MTLSEALSVIQQSQKQPGKRRLFLACGFEPLHLRTFLAAHAAQRLANVSTDVRTGLYGDLEGNLTAAAESESDAAAVIIEWGDLDARLGLRSAGGWQVSVQTDIVATCREKLARLLEKLRVLSARMPVALSAPTLPVPLFGHAAGWQIGADELELKKQLILFLTEAATIPVVSILHPARLDRLSPANSRLNPSSELRTGFPYTLEHASALAQQLVRVLFPSAPMKGLITDLDDTLWSGILGEVGSAGVSWSQAEHTQIHGLYQQLLRHLSEMGVLLAVASKNELALVNETMGRTDLYIPREAFYPIRADWGAKSRHVEEILRAWNIGPDAVVFVDDSPMELAEVRAAFPAMTCLQFAHQPGAALALFEQLRDLFGKPVLQREDALRQSSLKAFNEAVKSASDGDFVRSLGGKVRFERISGSASPRLLELINKTNQFNLNGLRVSEAEWLRLLADPSGFIASISYEDKFGPLGVIGVVAGRQSETSADALRISTWVMSCRAFSRSIEFHTLQYLFDATDVPQIVLDFCPTDRNQPLQEFLAKLGVQQYAGSATLSREQFKAGRHETPHQTSTAVPVSA